MSFGPNGESWTEISMQKEIDAARDKIEELEASVDLEKRISTGVLKRFGNVRQWHEDEAKRLRELHDRTGDKKALSKSRWHYEALKVFDSQ